MPYYRITITQIFEKELHGVRWYPQFDLVTIREKVLKSLYEKKSPYMIEKVEIIQLNDDDQEVKDL